MTVINRNALVVWMGLVFAVISVVKDAYHQIAKIVMVFIAADVVFAFLALELLINKLIAKDVMILIV